MTLNLNDTLDAITNLITKIEQMEASPSSIVKIAEYLKSLAVLVKDMGEIAITLITDVLINDFPYPATKLRGIVQSSTHVYLDWENGLSKTLTGHRVFRSDDDGATWTDIDQVAKPTNFYNDTTVTSGNDYQYIVVAYNPQGDAEDSNTVSVSTP